MATLSNALAGMSLGGGNDWGNPGGKPTLFTAELQGFSPEQQDIFYFFNEHPSLPTIADDEIEDIWTDSNSKEEYPVARLVVRNRSAALRALNFSHQLFDGREIIVTVDGLSLDDAPAQQPPQEEQSAHVEQPPMREEAPAPVRQEQPPQEQYDSRADEAAPPQEPETQPPASAEQPRAAWKPRKPRDEQPAAVSQEDTDGARGGGGNNYGVSDRGGGGGFNDRGNDRGGGGYGSGYARRDEGDKRQGGGGYGVGGGDGGAGGGRSYDRAPRGGDETFDMDADALAAASSGRPRLNLKKRTGGAAKASSRPVARPAPSRSSIFGNAKPREEVLRAKGVDPNAVRPARKEQQDNTSIRGGGNNRGDPAPQMDGKNAPPVVKNENVFDVLDAE